MGWKRNKRTGEVVFVPDETPGAIPIGPQRQPDLAAPFQGQKAQADISNTQANTARTQAQIQNDRERIGLAREANARAGKASEAAAEASRTASQLRKQQADAKLANLRAMENQIARVRQLYKQGPGATKGVMGAMDYLPTPANKQFDSAGAGLGDLGLAAFRVPGVGSQSDAELRAFIEANRPSSSDYDSQIEEKLRNLENRLSETYKVYGKTYGGNTIRNAPRKATGGNIANFDDWKD